MIQPTFEDTKKKLFLVPLQPGRRSISSDDKVFVSIDGKNGNIRFSSKAIDAMDMNGSFIKFAYDSGQHIVAWKVRKELDHDKLRELQWKLCKKSKSNQNYVTGVKRILDTFMKVEKKTYKLEVKKYKDKQSVIDNETYYFVEVV